MILDEYFERKLNNLFINSRDQDWSAQEFGQYFEDFCNVVAENEQKRELTTRRLFREAFDSQSPSNRVRHYFKYILNERIISFEEFVSLLEGQNCKEIDNQLKLLRAIHESITTILYPKNVEIFGSSLAALIEWLMEVYLNSVESIETLKKQDKQQDKQQAAIARKSHAEALTTIQSTLEKISNSNNYRYLKSLLFIVRNESSDMNLPFVSVANKIKDKMSTFPEPNMKRLMEEFSKSFDVLNVVEIETKKKSVCGDNPFITRLNSQNSLHLLSIWINVECIKFEVDDAVDRLLLLTKYFGLNFRTTMEIILITNVQKFTEYQEPIPDETELSYYTFVYHRLVPFIKRFVDRREEMFLVPASSLNSSIKEEEEPLSMPEISSLIIETLTHRVDWLKMIVNQMNGLLLANFFFKLEKHQLVESAAGLRNLIDPTFLDQSEDTFFGQELKFERLVNEFLGKDSCDEQVAILNNLDVEIALANFVISARFMGSLPQIVMCLVNISEVKEHFTLAFTILVSIVINNGTEVLDQVSHSFLGKFISLYLVSNASNPKLPSKADVKAFESSYLKRENSEFERVFSERNEDEVGNEEFMLIVHKVTKKCLKLFLENSDGFQFEQFLEQFRKLDLSYQLAAYLSTISRLRREPFKHSMVVKFLDSLRPILQSSEVVQKIEILSLIDRKVLKHLKEQNFLALQEEKSEWSQKLVHHVKDCQALTPKDMELYADILRRIGPKDFTKWVTFTLLIGQHGENENMENAVRLAFLLFQNAVSECGFALIEIVAEWLLFKSHSTQDYERTQDDLNRCIIRLMLMCVNASIKLSLAKGQSDEMEYLCNESEIELSTPSPNSMEVDPSPDNSPVVVEFKRFLRNFVQINSSQDAIFRQTVLTILFEETRHCFENETNTEFLPLFKDIVERLVKFSTDGITYETVISFFPLEKKEFRDHCANLLYLLNQSIVNPL